jgi:Family of unknown function (DUF6190)
MPSHVNQEFVDAFTFVGMHSSNESRRLSCKRFFVERLTRGVAMSLEHVGACDDVIWQRPREEQDAYYPFMDNLHTLMPISRRPYGAEDLRFALDSPLVKELPMSSRLLVAMVVNGRGILRTADPALFRRTYLPVRALDQGGEVVFPKPLEALYLQSLKLRFTYGENADDIVRLRADLVSVF